MNEHETIADLIAWLRRPREGENAYLTLWRDEIADRLEAAIKREKTAIEADALTVGGMVEAAHKREAGDAAKLREALRECAQYIACVGGIGVGEVTINDNVHLIPEELTQKAIAALAAPPRNCDRGTAQEQSDRMDAVYCSKRLCAKGKCPLFKPGLDCSLIWAQMPYDEEGGAK